MFLWSASKTNDANYCRRKYFLKYIVRRQELVLSSYRRGSLLHELVEEFWEKLGIADEIRRNRNGKITSPKKYSNAEEFVEYAQRQWMRMLVQDEKAGREVSWRHDDEKWAIRNKYLPEHCSPLFEVLRKEGPPVESELGFDFVLGNRRFSGRIDEVRLREDKIIIRDYKTERPWMGGMKLAGNPQLTLYCVGLSALCYADEQFASRLGMKEERKSLFGNPVFISEKIKPEFFMISSLPVINKPENEKQEWEKELKVIYETERVDRDFYELLRFYNDIDKLVEDFKERRTKTIPATEKGKKCDECGMRIACEIESRKELDDYQRDLKDSSGQAYFNYASPYLMKSVKRRTRSARQGKFRWKK